MNAAAALEALAARGDPEKATAMAAYHKVARPYLGVAVPEIDALVREWRAGATVAERVRLAAGLWDSNVHEARIASAKLLTQARFREAESAVWEEFLRWVPEFDGWAVADHACKAGERRLVFGPERLDVVETWTHDGSMWVRRAALVATLPWTKQRHPSVAERAARERILGWAADYVADREWFIQKSVAWWLRSLSLHEPDRVRRFLAGPGRDLKPFAFKDAGRRLPLEAPSSGRDSG